MNQLLHVLSEHRILFILLILNTLCRDNPTFGLQHHAKQTLICYLSQYAGESY